jgi:hypothetical protein
MGTIMFPLQTHTVPRLVAETGGITLKKFTVDEGKPNWNKYIVYDTLLTKARN